MDQRYEIVQEHHPEKSAWGIIGHAISAFNAQQAGDENARRICFVVQNPDLVVVGGVIGVVYWDWLYIDLMWVKDDLRGQGFGSRLLFLIEEEGKTLGAKNAYLDTFSFQAPGFYEKYGYRVFGELPEFPPGHQRFFLTKRL